jgi:hypothetical protein
MLPLLLALGWGGDPCPPTLWPNQWKNRLPTPRDRLSVPVGDALGFYASSLTAELKHDPRARFWDGARKVHGAIRRALKKTDLFRMLKAEALHPTLLDSLYFAKYELITSSAVKDCLMWWLHSGYMAFPKCC